MEPLDRFDCLQNNSLWQGTALGIESKVYIVYFRSYPVSFYSLIT